MADDVEMIAVSDKVILADSIEQWIGAGFKIGVADAQAVFAMTFAGKLNNSSERSDVTVMIGVHEAFELAGNILDAVDWAVRASKDTNDG